MSTEDEATKTGMLIALEALGAEAMAGILSDFAGMGVTEEQARGYLPVWWDDAVAVTLAGQDAARWYIRQGIERGMK